MINYKYKAIDASGKEYEAVIEANDKDSLFSLIRSKGETLISFSEIKKSESLFKKLSAQFGTMTMKDKVLFAKNLGSMLDAGLSLSRALSVIERQSSSPAVSSMMKSIIENVAKGQTLADSLSNYPKTFSKLFVSMVKAGEESGGLSTSLKVLSEQMEKTYLLKKKITGAMLYPGVIIGVMLIIGVLMMIYVVPTLTRTFSDLKVDLPFSTKAILGISSFITEHYISALIIFLIVIVSAFFAFKLENIRKIIDKLILKVPVIGDLIVKVNSARTARTLSSLLSAGVSVVDAFEVSTEVVQNSNYKVVLKKLQSEVQRGVTISSVIAEYGNLYPPFVSEMISVGEETGKLSDTLLEIAKYYENEVDQRTKDLSTIIEPVLMVIIGSAVGFFAISIISPMYTLMDSI